MKRYINCFQAKEAAIAGVDLAADTAKEITAESLSASSEEIKGKKRTRAASSRAVSVLDVFVGLLFFLGFIFSLSLPPF